ncbi:hypothetical protein EVB94_148 [Rhizobium phage RHph_TM40]|uniref:Uncharacterized protein n=1 Tax=Rhizobium phage RHph_Y65 TaxID=2509785 RepID=A0A7S5RC06_9CAUD|nr:hypothetical protein PQC17_gp148 [Rhizobium phage RHph_Y65]QIG71619.1 hypothetical protein EVB94_148 [Rhizobium phage RHph_TM40]QIG72706.1 hypothetical protein EVB97_148 [Rhizobium phage RHph_Y65]QIG77472.1 hypothetical protein EVB61_144 [Rhizobium phage RHph_TM21B]QIG77734.1 hypothetical protein EVB64_147 [Rhizobium phage RHph_TM61]
MNDRGKALWKILEDARDNTEQRLREHGFAGNLIAIRAKKCLVKGCMNESDQGTFIGDLCLPCHDMITTGKIHHTNPTFIGDLQRQIGKYDKIAKFHQQFMEVMKDE